LAVTEGSAPMAILEETEKTNTILIALGTHGRGGFEKLRLGSVAESVLRESDCPVLTVGPNVEPVGSVEIKSIVCPVDFSAESENALRYAAELAGLFDADLNVIHVAASSEEEDLAALCSWVPAETKGQCKLQELVRRGDVSEEILREAADVSADLIVIGVSHGTFSDATLGEKTTEILRDASCPVITVSAAISD
jgi:nucleotide-binding universal stress UspA family protein